MKKKILLIYPKPDVRKEHRFGYSTTLLYLASSFKNHNYEVKFIDYSIEEFDKNEFIQNLKKMNFVVVEIDAFPLKRSMNLSMGMMIPEIVKKVSNKIITIAIGKHCTLVDTPINGYDITIAGEPEIELPNILDDFKNEKYKKIKLIRLGNIKDLSEIPFQDIEILNNYYIKKNIKLAPSALLETMRGCYGRCIFCQRKGWSQEIRFFPEDRVCTEFQNLISIGIKNLWIIDENFTANLQHSKRILKNFIRINKNQNIKIAISSWTNIDEEFLYLAKRAGVSVISFGVESKNEEILDFYKKNIDFNYLDKILEIADNIGIYTVGNFILGAPIETEVTVQESIEYAVQSGFDAVNVKILDYMIGSELYDKLPKKLKKDKFHFFASRENGLCQFSLDQLVQLKEKFVKNFYMKKKDKIIQKILRYGHPYYTSR